MGILLGYRLHPGGRWRHEYQVAELPEFAGVDLKYDASPKQMKKIRVQIVQEVRLPEEGITFPLKVHYTWRNSTLEGVQSGLPLRLTTRPASNVEPLEVRTPYGLDPDDDDAVEDEDVGTSFRVAGHLQGRQGPNGVVEPPSGGSTPPTEIATPPDVRDLVDPLELRSADDARDPGGGIDQPLQGPGVQHGLHGADTDDKCEIDARGHKYPKDEYGARKRVSGRPPYIPTEWWKSMSHKKRLEAQLDYVKAQEAAQIVPNRGGSAGSRDPYPRKPAMTCVSACPMGAYGLLMQCKGVAETIAHGDDTNAPGSEADDLEFEDGHASEDDFDVASFEPTYTNLGQPSCHGLGSPSVPAMPTITRPPNANRERIPTIQAPFYVAVETKRRCTPTLAPRRQ